MVTDMCGMPTSPTGCPLPGDHASACQPEPPLCRCTHLAAHHITDRRGRVVCRSVACGCAVYRPQEPPVKHDNDLYWVDRYEQTHAPDDADLRYPEAVPRVCGCRGEGCRACGNEGVR